MSRKSQKERGRAEVLRRRLEELYRRGADDAFLDLVHEQCRDLPELPAAGRYAEVVDRRLRRALASTDWNALARTLKRVRREAAERPLVRLAEASRDLVEGRLDEARAALVGLAESPGLRPGLASSLAACCAPEEQRPPGIRSAWAVYERLAHLDGTARPQDVAALEEELLLLENSLPGGGGVEELTASLGRWLRLLSALSGLEADLRELREQGDEASRSAFDLLQEGAEPLRRELREAFQVVPRWNLLKPLQSALRLRWRVLLEMVQESDGLDALVDVAMDWPDLAAFDLADPAAPDKRGFEAGALWRDWNERLAFEEYRHLALTLEKRSRDEKDPERLVDLWDVEVWARVQEARGSTDAAAETLNRLLRVLEDEERLPSALLPELARRLRRHLLDLAEVEEFSASFLHVASALLAHLGSDPALLSVAVASAACCGDVKGLSLLAAQIAVKGTMTPADRDDVMRVASCLVGEEWRNILTALPVLRPLFGDEDWQEVLRVAAEGILEDVVYELVTGWDFAHLESIRRELETARAAMPELVAVQVLLAACDCLAAGEEAPEVLRRILAEHPEPEWALPLYRVLKGGYAWAPGSEAALTEARAAAIACLAPPCRPWYRQVIELVDEATPEEVGATKERLQALRRRDDLEPADREALDKALADVARLGRYERAEGEKEGEEPAGGAEENAEENAEEGAEENAWDDEDTKEYPLPGAVSEPSPKEVRAALERLYPMPHLVLKPLDLTAEPLQPQDLQPLLRSLRKQAVEVALGEGLRGRENV